MSKPKLFFLYFLFSFLVIFSGLIASGAYLLTSGRTIGQSLYGKSFAEAQLKDYLAIVLKQKSKGVKCQAIDGDGDGYVSCDYTTVSQPNNIRSVKCAAWGLRGLFNPGCKTRFTNISSQ